MYGHVNDRLNPFIMSKMFFVNKLKTVKLKRWITVTNSFFLKFSLHIGPSGKQATRLHDKKVAFSEYSAGCRH